MNQLLALKSLKILTCFSYIFISCICLFSGNIFLLKVIVLPISIYLFLNILNNVMKLKLTSIEYLFIVLLIQQIFTFRDMGIDTLEGKNKIYTEILILIACIGIFIINLGSKKLKFKYLLNGTSKYLLIYIIYIGLSLLFLSDNKIQGFFWYAKMFFAFILLHSLIDQCISNNRNKDHIINIIYYSLMFLQVFCWLYSWFDNEAVISKDLTGYYRLGNIIVHPTTMSLIASITCCISLKKILFDNENSSFNVLAFILSFVSLLFTFGRVGIIAGFTGMLFLVFNKSSRKQKIAYIYILLFFTFMTIVGYFYSNINNNMLLALFSRGQGLGNMLDLNGRIRIWSYTFQLLEGKNVLGYGYLSAGSLIKSSGIDALSYATVMESAYITIMVELGLIGLMILTIAVAYNIYETKNITKSPIYNSIKSSITLVNTLIFILLVTAFLSPSFGGKTRIHLILLFSFLLHNIWIIKSQGINIEKNKQQFGLTFNSRKDSVGMQ